MWKVHIIWVSLVNFSKFSWVLRITPRTSCTCFIYKPCVAPFANKPITNNKLWHASRIILKADGHSSPYHSVMNNFGFQVLHYNEVVRNQACEEGIRTRMQWRPLLNFAPNWKPEKVDPQTRKSRSPNDTDPREITVVPQRYNFFLKKIRIHQK